MNEAIESKLRTFQILYLVKGILTLVFSLFFVLYAGLGMTFKTIFENTSTEDLPFNPGSIFVIIGIIGFIICVSIGIVTLLASKYIKERRQYNFIFVAAFLNCLTGILGILLGVFTLIEITKPETKAMFLSLETEIN
ncbi:MAG: hypothetical protein ED556_10120 [Winogradskyella sp.]|uniref:hypothetical protein n=1 Tax=Winogradskyella sp. TaxID=1883156 RepID=UPI000F402B2F|nr:hypothetical protein [Winogradskyella sp.]RNC84928.1 MAG: hypothetical protein ED556_10120 [Winogradskyella sp.]